MRKFLLGAAVALTVASASPASAIEIKTQDDLHEDFIEYAGPIMEDGTPGHGDYVTWFVVAEESHQRRSDHLLDVMIG